MNVKIALVVGSNGKAAASTLADVDWGILLDCIMDYEPGRRPEDPDASVKYIVEVDVPLPVVATVEGAAKAVTNG